MLSSTVSFFSDFFLLAALCLLGSTSRLAQNTKWFRKKIICLYLFLEIPFSFLLAYVFAQNYEFFYGILFWTSPICWYLSPVHCHAFLPLSRSLIPFPFLSSRLVHSHLIYLPIDLSLFLSFFFLSTYQPTYLSCMNINCIYQRK